MLVAVDAMDFNFDSTCTSPYMSAPSSPRRFGDFYFSAPTSPNHSSNFYQQFNWDESIQNPKSSNKTHNNEDEEEDCDDFAFDFGGSQLERTSLSADELFDGGKIRPLLPPNRLEISTYEINESRNRINTISSPRSPTHGKKIFPFNKPPIDHAHEQDQRRGRTLNSSTSTSKSSRRRETRSLSPLRVAEFACEEQQQQQQQQQQLQSTKPTTSNSNSNSKPISSNPKPTHQSSRRWSLKDFLLFRSASEGRASDKDPLRKYTALSKIRNEDEKNNSSFRSSTDNPGSTDSRRKGPVSAHELHYKVNRAVSEESRRKTYLPYKPRLLGFLGFNPSVNSQRF